MERQYTIVLDGNAFSTPPSFLEALRDKRLSDADQYVILSLACQNSLILAERLSRPLIRDARIWAPFPGAEEEENEDLNYFDSFKDCSWTPKRRSKFI